VNTDEFSWPVRVYWEDTDAGGVVYYAHYLNFMERARSEWLRSLGFEQTTLIEAHGVVFVVRSVAVDYLRPARFNDLLAVTARLEAARPASLEIAQRVERDGAVLARGRVTLACVEAASFRPVRIPAHLLSALTGMNRNRSIS
jgi:acyl-CoA thioester hydrolase